MGESQSRLVSSRNLDPRLDQENGSYDSGEDDSNLSPVGRCHHIVHTPGLDLEAVDPELDAVCPGVSDGRLTVPVHQLRVTVWMLQQQLHHPGVAPPASDH